MGITFFTSGKPATQGSKTYLGNGNFRDSCKRLDSWRSGVRAAAMGSIPDGFSMQTGAVVMTTTFQFGRPKNHFGSGKNSNVLKPTAPNHHTQKPDTVKMLRAVEDALTGLVYKDDSQVVRHSAVKRWARENEIEGVQVSIEFY